MSLVAVEAGGKMRIKLDYHFTLFDLHIIPVHYCYAIIINRYKSAHFHGLSIQQHKFDSLNQNYPGQRAIKHPRVTYELLQVSINMKP